MSSAELQEVDDDHSVVRYKFAFQWCEGQGDPWWLRFAEHVSAQTGAGQDLVHGGQSSDLSHSKCLLSRDNS